MSWNKLDGKIQANSTIPLDAQTCRDYGVTLPPTFPFNKVQFTCQALAMLSSLNSYDTDMVVKEILQIYAHPNGQSVTKHSRNPLRRLWRNKYPFRNYHYLIDFELVNGNILIQDIYFDTQLYGSKAPFSAERTMLYEVKRKSPAKYDKAKTEDDIRTLTRAWDDNPRPVPNVRTAHAAVNGMQNELTKASWLMGTHLDAAYSSDGIEAYTLFHNPTDEVKLDLVECIFDKKKGRKSHNAEHLAAILAQNNQQRKQVKWVAHSQGAIIFCAALEVYRLKYGKPLTTQQLAIHGSGANLERLKRAASYAGLHVNSIRNNPYDLVPNLAGRNDLSKSSLARSLRFKTLVFGNDPAASPHTLPFLGLKTYAEQLRMLGYRDKAKEVNRFLRTLPKGDPRL
ncbi:hypothetical protein CYL31_15220 [Marinomonas sp. A3A]|uniref:hypothetical protein n=1 Tax=Marinomonas TaxID=28253 RepID=UPI001BB354D0|nr:MULTISPECIES: hypothetical protein [Marinomonas]QUX92664.1 hypothetical protein CYL31_15220 [Marinomonas sp. A3A]